MKRLNKLLAILLAVTMMMSLAVVVQADTYSITVTNNEQDDGNYLHDGENYSAYKIFDVEYSGTNYSYTITSDNVFYNTIASLTSYFTLTETAASAAAYAADPTAVRTFVVTPIIGYSEDDGSGNYVLVSDIVEALAAVDLSGTSADGSATLVSGTATIELDDPGYYFVTTTVGTAIMVSSAAPNGNVVDKNEKPTVEKLVSDDDSTGTGTYGETSNAEIGDTVYFKTTIENIEDMTSLVLHDTMETGLSFDSDSVSVTLYYNSGADHVDLTDGTDYDLDYAGMAGSNISDGCTFEIDFDKLLDSQNNTNYTNAMSEGAYIVVKYTATITADAEIYAGNDESNGNSTYLSYGDSSKTEKSKTQTYVYSLNIFKYQGSVASGNSLTGAEFKIYYVDGTTTYYAKFTGSDGDYTLGDDSTPTVYWTTDESEATTITTDSNGFINIDGLDADKEYYLLETKAPTGYNLLSSAISFTIAGSGSVSPTQGTVSYNGSASQYNVYGITGSGSEINNVIAVLNQSGTELVGTGDIGTTIFYVVGGILVVGAVVLLITKKRLGNKDE